LLLSVLLLPAALLSQHAHHKPFQLENESTVWVSARSCYYMYLTNEAEEGHEGGQTNCLTYCLRTL
jgi:hypothetical protein